MKTSEVLGVRCHSTQPTLQNFQVTLLHLNDCLAELYKGVYCSKQFEKNATGLENFLTLVGVIDFDRAAAVEFGKIQDELKQIGKPTGEQDAMIAAVSRSRQSVLVTNNTRHFENISNLQLEDWLI